MTDVAIIGAGGFARETLDTFEAAIQAGAAFNVLGFVVDAAYGQPGILVNDKPILGDFRWLEQHRNVAVVCAVGAPQDRWQLIERAKHIGVTFCSVIHPSVIKTRWMSMGEGCVICAGCVLSNHIHIGHHVHINPSCTIGHDVEIQDFVSLAPSVIVSGNVTLEQGAYMGTGAKIIEKKRVGAWSIIGAGSTVIESVPLNTTVVGTPSKVIKTRKEGWYRENSNH